MSGDWARVENAALAGLCVELAARVMEVVDDPRAADACIRFFGLARLPENVNAIAASLPRVSDDGGALRSRRVEQLVRAGEEVLAAGLTERPLIFAGGGDSQEVEAVFLPTADLAHRWQVLMRAWADIPDSDHQSRTALLVFETDRGLRPPTGASETVERGHRETRRRHRRRAQAILEVAVQRTDLSYRQPAAARRFDLASTLLLGPQVLAADGATWAALDAICRLGGSLCARRGSAARPGVPVDLDALDIAAAYAHRLAQAGSVHASAALGAVRRAVLLDGDRVPASLAARVLASTVVLARLRDDPAGFPAAWEAVRVCRSALTSVTEPPDASRITASGLRALQELAELYERFGQPDQAMRTLAEAYDLLRRRGDPDQEVQPDDWLQQLLFSQGMIQQRFVSQPGACDTRRRLHQAQAAEFRSVALVQDSALLPTEWGLTAEAVLADVVMDEAELLHRAGETSGAANALARARRIVAANELGWRQHGDATYAMARSARLTTIRAAARIALVVGDLDGYRVERTRLAGAVGPWLCRHDVEALDRLERTAERWGIRRTDLARRSMPATLRSHRLGGAPAIEA